MAMEYPHVPKEMHLQSGSIFEPAMLVYGSEYMEMFFQRQKLENSCGIMWCRITSATAMNCFEWKQVQVTARKKYCIQTCEQWKKGPRLFRVYGGDYTTQSYRDDIKPI